MPDNENLELRMDVALKMITGEPHRKLQARIAKMQADSTMPKLTQLELEIRGEEEFEARYMRPMRARGLTCP
jgi:hypothetical protein